MLAVSTEWDSISMSSLFMLDLLQEMCYADGDGRKMQKMWEDVCGIKKSQMMMNQRLSDQLCSFLLASRLSSNQLVFLDTNRLFMM